MAKDVIMPALGMAQETGTLLQWLKSPGDTITKGELLMEVERRAGRNDASRDSKTHSE